MTGQAQGSAAPRRSAAGRPDNPQPDNSRPSNSSQPQTQNIEISILVVAYQSADCISKCIGSIAAACRSHSFEVLLIDNGDGSSTAKVECEFPQVRIVPGQGNVGFAKGNNILASHARGRYLLLLNPDVELHPGAIDALMQGARHHREAAAWGGVTLTPSNQPDFGNSVHIPSLKEMASRIVGRSSAGLEGITFDADRQVEALSGSFVMVDRAVWNDVGGFDESYFLYCEEIDLFYRLAHGGHRFWQIADAKAIHDTGHGQVLSPQRMLFRAAGTMQFARLHWSPLRQSVAFALLWGSAFVRLVMGRTLGKWNERLKSVGDGHALIAMRPQAWVRGYDSERGLSVRVANDKTAEAERQ